MAGERMAFWGLLAATFAVRALDSGQPIVENYVGRQIPTAMVARNLERGSGFFHPELDTGPFPNRFLVEPPIYAQVVALLRPAVGFGLEPTGRLVSAAATALGAWGLYGICRRRDGATVALLAVASFGAFPVMVRYGRAFQPDALMLGFVLAGLRGWDEFAAGGLRRWAAFGGFVLATGLALKITSAWALIPLVTTLARLPIARRLALAASMLAPALAWYAYAWGDVVGPGTGSMASFDNAAIWLGTLSPAAWVRLSTYDDIARALVVRSFTPLGFGLATLGLFGSGRLDPVWKAWGIGCGLSLLALAAKWHHGYYWMAVAPLAAIGVARGLVRVWAWGRARYGRPAAAALGSSFLALCVAQSASTFRTPVEWGSLAEAACQVDALVPPDELLIAPEALLYQADRRGFRLEFDPAAARRAAGEWGAALPDAASPPALVEFYRTAGGSRAPGVGRPEDHTPGHSRPRFVADAGPDSADPRRRAWREAIRKRRDAKILVDRADILIAEFR